MFLNLILGTAGDCVNSWPDAGTVEGSPRRAQRKKSCYREARKRNRKGCKEKLLNAENAEMTKQTQTAGTRFKRLGMTIPGGR